MNNLEKIIIPSKDIETIETIEDISFYLGKWFYIRGMSAKIKNGAVVEILSDYEDDDRSDKWNPEDGEDLNDLDISITYEAATDDANDGYLLVKKDELNSALASGKIKIVRNPEEQDEPNMHYFKMIRK